MEELTIRKEGYQPFGWKLVGGNKIGIYVKEVNELQPAAVAGVQPGWKLVQVR